MRKRATVLATAALLAVSVGAGPAAAQPKVYSGREAAALRCSNTLALTAVALNGAELMSDIEKDLMIEITYLILDRHVSGTWHQKKQALRQVRDRRSVEETLQDYQRNAARCLRQFPIN